MNPEKIIKSYIEEKGLKVVFVARKADMSNDLLSKSLNGKRKLKPSEFIKICSLLGLDIKDFADTG